MSRKAEVRRLEYDTTDSGAEVTLTVVVLTAGAYYLGPRANVADIPPEAADALRRWLADAPTGAPS